MESARKLFSDYCYYCRYTVQVQNRRKGRSLRDLKETPARLKLLAHMAKWCGAQGINARSWLYSLFVSRRWMFCPALKSTHLQSKNHLPKYRDLRDFGLYRQRLLEQASIPAPAVTTFDPNRDLSHTAEETKAAYLRFGRSVACSAAMVLDTFGYHPRSAVCARCPEAKGCRDRLVQAVDFDVLALRLGEITSVEARTQALNRVQHCAR